MAGYTRTVILLAAMTALFGVIGLAIGGEQQQAFAVGVEPAGHIHTGQVDEILEAAPAPFGRELAQHAIGFVETDQHGAGAGRGQTAGAV